MKKLISRREKKAGPVQGEIWSHYLQRRVMRLLFLHDHQLFQGQFRTFFAQSTQPQIPLLQFYDRYIRLQTLGEELLAILPDIRRQLSLQIEYELLIEDAPTRGDIDWPQTITRAINETPDQPPLRFDTRLRQQNIATPENLLVVAILLNYRQIVQETLRADIQQETLNDQERLTLIGMEELIERELAASYARMLTEEASQADIESLIEQVTPHLKPGANPYRNLITWWDIFRDLHIGRTPSQRHLTLTNKYSERQTGSWLYQLWIALEILDLLNNAHLIVPDTMQIEHDHLQCLFTWSEQRFRFHYRRNALPVTNNWQGIETLITSYTIEREQPLKIASAGTIIWQEPPVMFAASYTSENSELASTQEATQQLLGGMQLSDARKGGLFSPFLPDPPEGRQWSSTIQPSKMMYAQRTEAHKSIRLYKITPDMAHDILRLRLQAVLQGAVEMLPERLAPTCYGIMLDVDTVNTSRTSVHNGNMLCPKPHIGEGVFDLVNDKLHCLKDPRFCHVYGQAITPPFVIRVETLGGLEQQNGDLRTRSEEQLREAESAGNEEYIEQLRNHIFLSVGQTIEQYVQRHGNTETIEARFEEWIFGDHWKKHPRCLAEGTRNNLLSGEYVWEEYKHTKGLNDWAAPAIQYCRALENEIHRRIHNHYPDKSVVYADVGQKGFNGHMTLGFLETIYSHKGMSTYSGMPPADITKTKSAKHNWPLCEEVVRQAKCNMADFEQMIQRIIAEGVTSRRNKLAHGGTVSQSDAQALRDAIIGKKGKPGILIWLAENLEPKA